MCVPRHGPVKTRRSGGVGSLGPKRRTRRQAQRTRRRH
jgi:hypothetical protein